MEEPSPLPPKLPQTYAVIREWDTPKRVNRLGIGFFATKGGAETMRRRVTQDPVYGPDDRFYVVAIREVAPYRRVERPTITRAPGLPNGAERHSLV